MSDHTDLVARLRKRAVMALEDGNMTAKCDAEYFSKSADLIEAQAKEIERLREAALHFHAYVKLWSDDLAARLKPTPESLAEAGSIARKALVRGE